MNMVELLQQCDISDDILGYVFSACSSACEVAKTINECSFCVFVIFVNKAFNKDELKCTKKTLSFNHLSSLRDVFLLFTIIYI